MFTVGEDTSKGFLIKHNCLYWNSKSQWTFIATNSNTKITILKWLYSHSLMWKYFIRELLASGNLGSVVGQGTWEKSTSYNNVLSSHSSLFQYSIDGNTFIFEQYVNKTWVVREVWKHDSIVFVFLQKNNKYMHISKSSSFFVLYFFLCFFVLFSVLMIIFFSDLSIINWKLKQTSELLRM